MTIHLLFTSFCRGFKKFKRMSLGSKYDEINYFYENYDSEKVKDEEKRGRDYKQFEITDNRGPEPKSTKKEETKAKKPHETQKPLWIKSTKKEETEAKNPNEIQKPLWIKLNKNDFDSLIEDVYNNLHNDEFKTTVDKMLMI